MSKDQSLSHSLSGFILTRQWRESATGVELIYWLAGDLGPLRFQTSRQEAVSFFPSHQEEKVRLLLANQSNWRIKPTKLQNFSHENVSALYFQSQRALFDWRDKLAINGVALAESDLKPTDRFLMERFITGAVSYSGEVIEPSKGQSKGQPKDKLNFRELVSGKLTPSDYRPQFKALSIDIETNYAGTSLYSIGLYSDTISEVFMIGESGNSAPVQIGDEKAPIDLIYCANERNIILAFLDRINSIDPDVVMGWNVVNFDLRVLQNICDRWRISFRFGRNNEQVIWRKAREGNDRYYALVPGRAVLDGIELMRSATYQFENFSLEFVARKLLNRGKLVEDIDQRGEEITELFNSNKPALARYNLEDCRLVWDIFELENLLNFAIERSSLTGLELDRYGGSVAAFDFLYLPRLHRKGFVAPSLGQVAASNVSPGGYVMRSIPGIHNNVIVLDFKSLYPSIIRTFHVDPLALVVAQKEEDAIPGYDNGSFSRSAYILPELIVSLWAARDQAKANHNAVMSQAIKIIMNSFYGVLGTSGCRFLDSRLVSSITKRGHEIIIESKNQIEKKGYEVIYGDTDSVFVLLGEVKSSDVPDIGHRLAEELNDWWRERLQKDYNIESYLEIEFETHFSKFLMPTVRGSDAGSKKRYAGMVMDNKDQSVLKMLFKGLETVRSDWSPLAREFQQVLYERIFRDQPYVDFIKQTVADILDEKFESELVLRKRLRRKLDDYVKNVPPHVQAARKAEVIRKGKNLPSLYESGGWIEYIMTVSGPEPRQYRQSPIDFDFYIEKQLTPIVDSILVFKSSSMNEILNQQIGLF